MITWNDILNYLRNGNPEPPRLVIHTDEEWKKILPADIYQITRMKYTEQAGLDSSCSQIEPGIYTCICCDSLLFDSQKKFNSGSGWPSFTQPVTTNAIRYTLDLSYSMKRVEALCNVCGAHIGHVFPDGPSPSRLRYCINSLAIKRQEDIDKYIQTAVFGGGCFWCTEAIFKEVNGVIGVEAGYTGGTTDNPDYNEVCQGSTGHAEVIRVTYEPQIIDYAGLIRIHLSTHDPTTVNRLGHDVGRQYRSVIFYENEEQKAIAIKEISLAAGLFDNPIVTEIKPLTKFYPAEAYHQDYYAKHPKQDYCQYVIMPKLVKFRQQVYEKSQTKKAE